jgi:hypothetical protein
LRKRSQDHDRALVDHDRGRLDRHRLDEALLSLKFAGKPA